MYKYGMKNKNNKSLSLCLIPLRVYENHSFIKLLLYATLTFKLIEYYSNT